MDVSSAQLHDILQLLLLLLFLCDDLNVCVPSGFGIYVTTSYVCDVPVCEGRACCRQYMYVMYVCMYVEWLVSGSKMCIHK